MPLKEWLSGCRLLGENRVNTPLALLRQRVELVHHRLNLVATSLKRHLFEVLDRLLGFGLHADDDVDFVCFLELTLDAVVHMYGSGVGRGDSECGEGRERELKVHVERWEE